jgi:hypothetical protein
MRSFGHDRTNNLFAGKDMASTPTPRVGRLDTLPRVRRELVRLYTDARQGRLDPCDASRLASVLALVGRLIEGGELETRLAELEALAEGRP